MKFLCTLAVATFLLFGSAKCYGSAFCPDPTTPVTAQRAYERMPIPEQADRVHECQKEALNDQATPNIELPATWSIAPTSGRNILARTDTGFAAPCSIARGQATRTLLVPDDHNARKPVSRTSKALRKYARTRSTEYIRMIKTHNLWTSIVRRHFA